ncbi:MAG TPA: low molecular weight phosphatase family protein [Microbacteriaceae bacterium]|nr:low molecular weight phosphatase family protein [Microbacteriaceae bacterium]
MTAVPQAVPYRILVVCTGNICRSPFAERLLRDAFERLDATAQESEWRAAVDVSSAGTHAMVGRPIEPAMAALVEVYGSASGQHAATQLDPELIARADLVLALTRGHRREVVRMLPSASRRVFALNEFTRLLEDARAAGVLDEIPSEESVTAQEVLAELVEAAASRRGFTVAPDAPEVDDVIDPYGRDASVYETSAAHIAEIVGRIEAVILSTIRAAG